KIIVKHHSKSEKWRCPAKYPTKSNHSDLDSQPMNRILTILVSALCVLCISGPLFAQSSYPPTFKDARVETYRKIDSTELKLWIFGESDPKVRKPAIVFFFGGGWNSGSPDHHVGPHTPPTLILHGKKDTTVPYTSVVAFESVMKKAERPCKLVGYEGAGHGFFNRGKDYSKTLAEADAFLVDLGWLKSEVPF
ncbi:MAG: dienelactone hydrolase family protein, partial [Candidatus Paceibacterota bacterium]